MQPADAPGAVGAAGADPAAAFAAVDADGYRLQAPLRFGTVAALRGRGLALIDAAAGQLTVDLSSVPSVDSAGLALLVDWLAHARGAGKRLCYVRAAPALLALARLSDVESLLESASQP